MIQSIAVRMYLLIVCALIIAPDIQAGSAGKNGFAMLKVDVDARAAAMAGAYTALAGDAAAAYWNPAGLTRAGQRSFIIMHNEWLADIRQEFAAFHFLQGKHHLAVSANLMTIPDIELRGRVPTLEPQGTTEAFTFAAALSYARIFKEYWQVGLSLKYLFEKYYLENAPGWAIDLGVMKKDLLPNLDWGFSLQNVGRMSQLREVRTPLPLMIRNGFAYHYMIKKINRTIILSNDLQYIHNETFYFRLGGDLALHDYLHVRLGWINGADDHHFTFGLGLNYASYHFDYAFVSFDEAFGHSHRFSLGIHF